MKKLLLISILFLAFCSCSPATTPEPVLLDTLIKLKLRVHIMKTSPWTHSSGVLMNNWVTPKDFNEIIILEINEIWSQADIKWDIESIIEEDIIKFEGYEESIIFIASTERDSEGRSNPERLSHLFSLMNPQNMSIADELESDLFHIYLFPFIGNTSQGNAMRGYNFHSIVGIWSNKHNGGGNPEKTLLKENHDLFVRGSLSRTISHELGHVLNLTHGQCDDCLMKGRGYGIIQEQIDISQEEAKRRLQ